MLLTNRGGLSVSVVRVGAVALAGVVLGMAAPARAGVVLKTYVGPAVGIWNAAGNWSPFGVPQNGGGFLFDVLIDSNSRQFSEVSLTGSFNIQSLTVTTGDTLLIGNGGLLSLAGGSLSDSGAVVVNSAGATTDLRFDAANTTLSGPGATSASNTQANRIYCNSSANRITVASGHTLRGAFQLGLSQTRLTNEGLIDADLPANASVNLTAGDVNFNTGTMRASNGATLGITSTTIDNTGGLIEAAAGSLVNLTGVTIRGGTLLDTDGAGPGAIRNAGSTTLEDVTIEGEFNTNNGTSTFLRGTIDLQGPFHLNSAGATTDLRIDTTPFTLAGPGDTVATNTQSNRIYGVNSNVALTIAPEHTVRGSFKLGVNQTSIINKGSILADASLGITIDPTANPGFLNQGLLHSSSGNVTIGVGTFSNTGMVLVDAKRTLTRSGTYIQDDGETQVNGTLSATTGVTINGGTLMGNGTVTGAVTNSSGTVAPGASAGILSLTSGYTQQAGGTLSIEIGGATPGTGYDRLAITGNATLAGSLSVARINGFVPTPGSVFTILTCTGTRSGTFGAVTSCDSVLVTYTANSVQVEFTGLSGVPGDINNDGIVNGADLALVLGNWGVCTKSCCVGDLDGNGIINGADLAIVLGNWSP